MQAPQRMFWDVIRNRKPAMLKKFKAKTLNSCSLGDSKFGISYVNSKKRGDSEEFAACAIFPRRKTYFFLWGWRKTVLSFSGLVRRGSPR